MNKYNPNIHHRRSIRLKEYDYSQAGLYFITLCCQNRKHYFGNIENGELILNQAGKIVKEEWLKTKEIRKNIEIHEYIVMPNHFHAIIEILFSYNENSSKLHSPENNEFKSPSQTIGAIIRGFKGASTKKIKEYYFSENNNSSTGELQFAPTKFAPTKFAPTKFAPTKFAPTKFAPTKFAPTEISLTEKIWQRDYYEHIIRNEKSYLRISEYIVNNPAKWNNDKFYTE